MKGIVKILFSRTGALSVTESFALKIVSLLLSLILWVTVLGFKREEIIKQVKLEPLLPPGMVITNKIPSSIQFTLSGARLDLKDLDRILQPIRPDLRRTRESTTAFSITEDLLGDLPRGVRIVGYTPQTVLIRLEEMVEKYVAVKPTLKGSPGAGYEVRVRVSPSKVAVAGPRSLIELLESVGTEPIDVQDLNQNKEMDVPIEVDTEQGFQLSREKVVNVRLIFRKVMR